MLRVLVKSGELVAFVMTLGWDFGLGPKLFFDCLQLRMLE